METKASAPETALHLSNQSGSPTLAATLLSPNDDSVIDNSVKNHVYALEFDSNINNNNNVSNGSSSDGGFVSGKEEFATALEKPQKPHVGGDDTPFAGSVESLTLKSEEAVVNLLENDDNGNKVFVGESKVGALKEDELVREKGKGLEIVGSESSVKKNGTGYVGKKDLSEMMTEKIEVEGTGLENGGAVERGENKVYGVEGKEFGGVVEENKILGGGSEKVDGVKFTGGGDSLVEAVNVDLLGSGLAVVGDVEGSKDSEIKGVRFPGDGSVPLDNGFDKISGDVEGVADVSTESGKHVGPVPAFKIASAEEVCNGGEADASGMQNDRNSDVGAVVGNAVVNNNQVSTETEVSVDEPETDNQTKQIESAVKGGNDKIDGGDEEGAPAIGSTTETAVMHSAHEVGLLEDNQNFVSSVGKEVDAVTGKSILFESTELNTATNAEVNPEADVEEKHYPGESGENEGSATDGETEGMIFGSSEAAKQFLEELGGGSVVGSHSGAESSHDHSRKIDGQIVTDSDEEADTDEEGEGKEPFDSSALAALLKAATSTDLDGGTITLTSQDGTRLFSVERPAGLGSSLRSVRPASRPNRSNLFTPSTLATEGDLGDNLTEEEKKTLEMLQQIRLKFLRLVHRAGCSPEDAIVGQVLYRLALVAAPYRLVGLDAAKVKALQLEAEGQDDLNFSLNILVLGKTGVGKSATINSIFGEEKSPIHAFEPATTSIKEITGVVDGVKIRVIDTPGLKCSGLEQGANRKSLSSIKKFMKKYPPDVVLYVDRIDTLTRDLNDLPLFKSINTSLGSAIWPKTVITLTHGASAPPEGQSGSSLSYELFITQRSHIVQQLIGHTTGDLRIMNPNFMNPVSLVENHPSCRRNRDGQKILPNGQAWRSQLLLLCYSLKILSEANALSKSQEPFDQRKLFGFRARSPPLPYLLSWLLQPRTHPKLSTDQGGDNVDSDIDLADVSDSDGEDEDDEYDQLPPFKPLRKTQIAKLSKEQRKAYFEEYDYRVKLLQKKQWKEELRRMREIKKKGKVTTDEYSYMGEDVDPENGGPAAVPVPLPDMVLPPSFDGDNPAYRYRFLEPTSQFLARPVLDTHGWDHDCGYDGVNIEHALAIANQFPAAVTVQVTKDKKEFNIHLDSSISARHGENGSSMAGFDIQNVGKQLAYVLRGETKFKNFKKNKTAAGISVTFLGENVATGFKLEDQIALGKRLVLVGSTGTVRSQNDSAYGANLEVRLREADYPIGQDQSSLGLSLVKWRGDLALGANLQSQFSVGRGSKIAVRAGLNNKMSGQITVRTSSSEQLQIVLVGLLPIVMAIYKSIWPGAIENYSPY